ncbi:unnamed protein product, partial [marine sediment metagenome]
EEVCSGTNTYSEGTCNSYSIPSSCNSNVFCLWKGSTSNVCLGGATSISPSTCSVYKTSTECYENWYCKWTDMCEPKTH